MIVVFEALPGGALPTLGIILKWNEKLVIVFSIADAQHDDTRPTLGQHVPRGPLECLKLGSSELKFENPMKLY